MFTKEKTISLKKGQIDDDVQKEEFEAYQLMESTFKNFVMII